MGEVEQVTVIVYGARSLQGKKSGRHKYSVIFGVGGKKYRTDIVKDTSGRPDWNEESVITVVHQEDSVFFTVTEKDDILGSISIPVSSIQPTKGRVLRVPLGPHKKCPKPRGDLIYQCYVSKYRSSHPSTPVSAVPPTQTPIIRNPTPTPPPPRSGFAKWRKNITTSPLTPRKLKKNKRNSDTGSVGKNAGRKGLGAFSNLNKKFSQSLHDLFSFARTLSETQEDSDEENERTNGDLRLKSVSINYVDEIGMKPDITAITPKDAPSHGGTQIVILGQHLGLELTDITEFSICGCDLTDTLEYESPMRLYCKTKRWRPGLGDVIIETTSGGRRVLIRSFTFTGESSISDDELSGEDVFIEQIAGLTTTSDVRIAVVSPNQVNGSPNLIKGSPNIKGSPQIKGIRSNSSSSSLPLEKTLSDDSDLKKGLYQKKTHDAPKKEKFTGTKHQRRASESVLHFQREEEIRKSWTKAELHAQVMRLEGQNKGLKSDVAKLLAEKVELKAYIDRLLAKVIQHCPDTLCDD